MDLWHTVSGRYFTEVGLLRVIKHRDKAHRAASLQASLDASDDRATRIVTRRTMNVSMLHHGEFVQKGRVTAEIYTK